MLESTERAKCLDMMEADITGEDSETRDRYIVIMGGDGSLATTINMLRTRQAISKALAERLISFVLLPFGTGCDGAQIFGWGNCPQDEEWFDNIDSLSQQIVTAENDSLSFWTVEVQTTRTERAAQRMGNEKRVFTPEDDVDVGIYDVYDRPYKRNKFYMANYMTIGFECRVSFCKYHPLNLHAQPF